MGVRRRLLREHVAIFGGYLFDGQSLFLTRKLPQDVTELQARDREENLYKITVKFASLITNTDGRFVQIMNLILRRAMQGLNLQLVQRNFYDPPASVS